VLVQVLSVNGHGQLLVDSGARSEGGPGSRQRGTPRISLDKRNIYLHPLQAFSGLYTNPKCICVRGSAPTQSVSSYYYLSTRPGPRAPHWLLTGILMNSVLTQNFVRMSFDRRPLSSRGPYARAYWSIQPCHHAINTSLYYLVKY